MMNTIIPQRIAKIIKTPDPIAGRPIGTRKEIAEFVTQLVAVVNDVARARIVNGNISVQ